MDGIIEPGRRLMMARGEVALAHAYLTAKKNILNSPYKNELVMVMRSPAGVSESEFLRELAWVILSAGMAEEVIRKKFPDISRCFMHWQSARSISDKAEHCIANALCHFRHEGKIRAIARAASILCEAGSFEALMRKIFQNPISELQFFPYIGPITAFHIAKNIGVRVAKPDRHLVRLARLSGFESVNEFCGAIASFLGEDIRLVDTVLWRFATMHDDYTTLFSQFMEVIV
jgi:hypothetical protein